MHEVVPIALKLVVVYTESTRYMRVRHIKLVAFLVAAVGVSAVLFSPQAHATTFTVTNTNDSGAGSLRQAITNANNDSSATSTAPHLINFNIAGSGVQTITPASALPTINRPTTIDGTTQSGASCGTLVPTLPATSNTPHNLTVEINAANLSTGAFLFVGSGATGSAIKGLILDGFNTMTGYYFRIDAATTVSCNYVGVSSDGATTPANAKASGFYITQTADNSTISNNLVTVNGDGIYPAGASNDRIVSLTIADNLIGTTASGFGTVTSGGTAVKLVRGIYTNWLDNASIRHNIIANTSAVGIWFFGSINSSIRGNYIGVGIDGKTVIPTNAGISGNSDDNSIIGGPNDSDRNVIGGLSNVAINIYSGTTNGPVTIQNNYIGLGADGVTPINNGAVAINLTAAHGTMVLGNTIVNGANGGVNINSINNVKVQGNYIGVTASGTQMKNQNYGITVGGTSTGTLIGGTNAGQGNVISGQSNTTSDLGILIRDTSSGTTVQGNYIGVGPDGVTAVPNGQGVDVINTASNVLIGGSTSTARNIISGNKSNGVLINATTTASSNIVVQGNHVGLDKNGNTITGSTQSFGVYLQNPNGVLIGGGSTGQGNVVSGNTTYGIYMSGTNFGQNVQIYGNTVGLKPDNETAAPNGTGISTGAMSSAAGSVLIGGSSAGQGNIISGNTNAGISLANAQFGSFPMMIKGNTIGLSASGVVRPNNGGISASGTSSNVIVGGIGTGEGNKIASNKGNGVNLTSASNSNFAIRGNSIVNNVSLGIDLGNNGPTNNDLPTALDADTGANGLQNFPRRTTLTSCGQHYTTSNSAVEYGKHYV